MSSFFKCEKLLTDNSVESGGLLIGYFRRDHLHVTQLTVPYPKDKSTRYRFFREDPKHIQILQRLHNESNGQLNLLGEWHTHPEFDPTPSSIDRREWEKIQNVRRELPTIFLIAGIVSNWVGRSNGEHLPLINDISI